MQKIAQIIIFALLASCSLLRTNISSIESADNLFLCFPDTDVEYSSLELNEKLSVQKQIFQEKQRRQLQCDNYENYASAEKSLDKINEEEMRSKLENVLEGSFVPINNEVLKFNFDNLDFIFLKVGDDKFRM